MNNSKIKIYNFTVSILIAILVLHGKTTFAQEVKVVQDLNLWTGVALEKSFLKDWTISIKQELRLEKDVSQINNVFTQVGIEYDINRNFSLEGKYRYIRNRKSDGAYENNSRYNADFKYKGEISHFTINYRLRYQKEVESMRVFNTREPYEKYLRQRITVNYDKLKLVRPYISAEIFQHYELYEFSYYDQLRILAGIRYEPKDIGQFNFVYGFDRELNTVLPCTCFIIKVYYTYKF